MSQINLKKIGLTDQMAQDAALYNNYFIGRVLSQSKDLYQVLSTEGTLMAEVSGKFRYTAEILSAFPAVGDFVLLDRNTSSGGTAIIHKVLPRKSAFIRKAAGTAHEEQVVATNIDTVFICMSLNQDFNLRRLERYLSIGWDSGALPVIVLTKSDLCDDLSQKLSDVESVAIGADILMTSALQEDGYQQIAPYIQEGKTIAFIGSSGVGKSTLINRLSGDNQMETDGLRDDDKGRHTTTRRQLLLLEQGGMVIDTPGMRELGLENANLSKSFADIDALAALCKFNDCTHTQEPGCAVQQAIADGSLPADRLLSYQKLKKEAKYEGLESRQIETIKLNEMFHEYGGMKNARKFAKSKNKRK